MIGKTRTCSLTIMGRGRGEPSSGGSGNIHFDHVLEEFVGPAGKWQFRQLALILAQNFAGALPFMLHIFAAHTPEHRCKVDICDRDGEDAQLTAWHTNFTIPSNQRKESFLKEDQVLSKCFRRPEVFDSTGTCENINFGGVEQRSCHHDGGGYVYDRSVFSETITTQLDLVCDDGFKVDLIGSILMVGLTVGCLVGGPLGDKWGRRKAILGGVAVMAPTVMVEGFVPLVFGYYGYAFTRLVVFSSVGVLWVCAHALNMELFGQHYRKVGYSLNSVVFSVTASCLSIVAYLERDWRYLHLWVGLLSASVAPAVFLFLEESIRWRILNGADEDEAEGKLLEVARVNGRHLSDTQCREMRATVRKMAEAAKETDETRLTVLDMFRGSYLITTLISLTFWISSVMAFYALALNVANLAGDMFINYAVSSLIDIPAILFIYLLIDRIGRRRIIMSSQTLLGACLVALAFVPKDQSTSILLLYLVGRFSATCSLNTAWFYTAELFPTNLRAQACATCSLVSRVVGISASFVGRLSSYWEPLSMLVLGLPALASAALTYRLQETMGKELKEMAGEEEQDEEGGEGDVRLKLMAELEAERQREAKAAEV